MWGQNMWGQALRGGAKSQENRNAACGNVQFRVGVAWGQTPFRVGTGPLELRFFC